MSHSFTTANRTAVQSTRISQLCKFEIQDPDLNWVDVSTALDTPDWFNTAEIRDSIDSNTMSLSAELLRDTESLSLCPLREDSTINRDQADDYAPMLDLHRMWRLSTSVVAFGDSPSYKEIGKGYIDIIDVQDQSPVINVTGRGEEAVILDAEVLEETVYSSLSDQSMEAVIQQLLDDWLENPPTLHVPVATSVVMNAWTQTPGNLMQAIVAVATTFGYVVRYRYDTDGTNKLTLFEPDREAAEGDQVWTIAATEYLRLPTNRLDITGVRNYIRVNYFDAAADADSYVLSPYDGTSGTIGRFGRRPMVIELGDDSQITTEARAQALADAVYSDLSTPPLEQQFETYGFWFVQLCDWGKLTANNIHYDTDQYGGVTALAHRMSNGVVRSIVDLGGQPKGGYRRWKAIVNTKPPIIFPPPILPVPPLPPKTGPVGGITGCVLWLKAETLTSTILDAGQIGTWYDSSGSANHAIQATSGNQPTLQTDELNGYPIVRFDGNDDILETPQIMVPTLSPGSMLFWVMKQTSSLSTDNAVFFCFKNASEANGTMESTVVEHQTAANDEVRWQLNGGGGNSLIGDDTANVYTVYALAFTSTSSVTPYVNGVAGTPFSISTTIESGGRNILRFGRVGGGGEPYAAGYDMPEVVWYSGLPTASQILQVNTYLMTKYAI
jgi:hypothetical protein